jgi:hypothetical protein
MSDKKYSDSVWKGTSWGQIGEELKKSGNFFCVFITQIKVTVILFSPKF